MKYDESVSERYDSARRLPAATMRMWLDVIAKHVPANEIRTIVDVGCGTGRFCGELADKFDARVIGVDPSRAMLAKARSNVSDVRVKFGEGSAECLPVGDGSACLIYMSMVYHHIAEPRRGGREFKRVLRPGGFVCIRNATKDLLSEVLYLKYFPTAMDMNQHRLPWQEDVVNTMQSSGLLLVTHEVIEQQFAESPRDYCDKISHRGLSDLVRLPDAEFHAGIQRMREAIERREVSGPILEPVDLFVFKSED